QKATTATAFRKSSAGIPAQVLSEVGRRGSPRGPAPVESSVRAALARGSADPASPTAPHGTTGRLAEMPERSSDVESALRSSWLPAIARTLAAARASYALRLWPPATCLIAAPRKLEEYAPCLGSS